LLHSAHATASHFSSLYDSMVAEISHESALRLHAVLVFTATGNDGIHCP